MRYVIVARESGTHVLFRERGHIVEGEVFSNEVPVECLFMFESAILPIGMDTTSLRNTLAALIALGFDEARARANPADPYVPFDRIAQSEAFVRTIQMFRDMPNKEQSEKILRALQRMRRCGHVAYDMSRKSAAA